MAATALALTGKLTQLSGTNGCVSDDGTGGDCADGKALKSANSVALSPDAKSVYAASPGSDAVDVFSRDTSTGKLTQLSGTDGCVSDDGSGGDCTDGNALNDPASVAVSPDGKSAYVAVQNSDVGAVAVFSRDTSTGVLNQLSGSDGCVSENGGGGCAEGDGLVRAVSVAVSPDGKSVYVASLIGDAVAVFSRDTSTGKLTQLSGTDGCVSEDGSLGECTNGKALDGAESVAVSSDGTSVYVGSQNSDAVAVFSRDTSTGKLTQLSGTDGCVSEDGSGGDCANGKALDNTQGVALSPDGKSVYVASFGSNAVAAFKRNTSTGKLTQLLGTKGCVSEDGSGGDCADGKALAQPVGVAVSQDKKSVYVGSFNSNAVAAFSRSTKSGKLTQLSGTAGCVSENGTGGACADGRGLEGASRVAVTPETKPKSVYAASQVSDAVDAFARSGS